MKYTLAVACLVGAVQLKKTQQDTTTVWSLKSVNDHRDDQAFQKFYGDYQTDAANKRPPYQSHAAIESESETSSDSSDSDEDVQVRGDDSESDHSKEFYNAWNAVKDEEEGYHRVIPAYFSADSDDLFMRSMCKTYALEGKNKDGSPNGNFVMDEATTRAAASEVLETHKGLKGDEKKKYLDTYFARTFAHFDVTKGGKVEVIKMPQFMRFLASDQYMTLQN
jgi:hypothetical protein